MQKYDFEIIEGENISYTFQTDHQFKYAIRLKLSDYIFQESIWSHLCYEFTIDILETPSSKLPPLDNRISPTIAAIFLDFLKNKEKVILYTCETKDGKESVRARKFNIWFRQFNSEVFLKIDKSIYDKKLHITYYNSLIISINNPFKDEIIQDFNALFESLESEK